MGAKAPSKDMDYATLSARARGTEAIRGGRWPKKKRLAGRGFVDVDWAQNNLLFQVAVGADGGLEVLAKRIDFTHRR